VVIGEGIKDDAPGIFLGEHLGTWEPGVVPLDIAVDPVDGTTKHLEGFAECDFRPSGGQRVRWFGKALKNLPSFYCEKLAYGPRVRNYMLKSRVEQVKLEASIEENVLLVAKILNAPVHELTITMLDRPRHEELVKRIRKSRGAVADDWRRGRSGRYRPEFAR